MVKLGPLVQRHWIIGERHFRIFVCINWFLAKISVLGQARGAGSAIAGASRYSVNYWIWFFKSVLIPSGRRNNRISSISQRSNWECNAGRDYLSGGLIATSSGYCAAAGSVCPFGGKFEFLPPTPFFCESYFIYSFYVLSFMSNVLWTVFLFCT